MKKIYIYILVIAVALLFFWQYGNITGKVLYTTNCYDSDGGKNYSVYGIVTYRGLAYTDSCSLTKVKEYYCRRTIFYIRPDYVFYNCTYGCSGGKCNAKPQNVTCTDSDGGLNLGQQGTCADKYGGGGTDYCTAIIGTLKEYYCENGVCAYNLSKCGSGYYCDYGACIKVGTNYTCNDSDGGINYYTKGTAKFLNNSYTDYCNLDNSTYLKEFFCNNSVIASVIYSCPSSCKEGLCIRCNDTANRTIHTTEGERILLDESQIISLGDSNNYTRKLQLTDNSCSASSGDYVTFTEIITHLSFKVVTGATCKGILNIDGDTYYVANLTAGPTTWTSGGYSLTWGANATYNNPGAYTATFPCVSSATYIPVFTTGCNCDNITNICSVAKNGFMSIWYRDIYTPFVNLSYYDDWINIDGKSSDLNEYVTFTSALAGSAGQKRISFAHNDQGNSTLMNYRLADVSNKTYHVVEGETLRLNEYMVVDSGDYGRILQLTDVSSSSSSGDYITFTDAISGESMKVVTGASDRGRLNLDGQVYYVSNISTIQTTWTAGGITVNWGANSTYGNPGSVTTKMPEIKLAYGSHISFGTADLVREKYNVALAPQGSQLPIVVFKYNNTSYAFVVASLWPAYTIQNYC